ncbi:MAG: hypothetical protein OXM01_07690 [Gemmatimonadota bacterium]|nr:hypothetical protein [Gemmatimonadota bacterium]
MKKVRRPVDLYRVEGHPTLFASGETIMAALQYYSPQLADERAYYGALMGWSFFFDAEERMPVGLPANELIHRNLYYLYGIERREVRCDNFADLWQAIEELIAADRVLLAWVDARDVSDAAFRYNRTPSASEAMLIYGYEQATDMLTILVNPQGFVGQVPLSCLPAILPELVVYDYAVPQGLDPYPVEKMEQVLLEDVREMLAGNKVGRVETGLPAAQRFVEEMERQIEQDEESMSVWMQEVFSQIALLGPQRQRLDDNLRRLAAATGLGALSAAADTFGDIGRRWEATRVLFFKGACNDPAAMLKRIRECVQGLLSLEETQARFLLQWL